MLFVSKWANYCYREPTEWLHDAQFGAWEMLKEHGLPVRFICEDNLDEDLSGYRGLYVAFSPMPVIPAKPRAALEALESKLPSIVELSEIPASPTARSAAPKPMAVGRSVTIEYPLAYYWLRHDRAASDDALEPTHAINLGQTMIRCFVAAVFVVCSATFAQAHKPTTKPIGANLAPDGGFEAGGWPFVAANGCEASGQVTKEQAHSGSQSFKITNKSNFAPNVYGKIEQIISGLDPFTTYRISCYVKGRNVGICWIGGGPGWAHRMAFPKGTYDWTYVENTWTTDANAGAYELMVATESPTEAVYVDDIKFEPIAVDAAKRDAILAEHAAKLTAQEKHLNDVHRRIMQLPGASADATLHLGLYIAERYLDRINGGPAGAVVGLVIAPDRGS